MSRPVGKLVLTSYALECSVKYIVSFARLQATRSSNEGPAPMTTTQQDAQADLTRPIIGIENRTADEVFSIMVGRIRLAALSAPTPESPMRELQRLGQEADAVATILARCEALEDEAADGLTTVVANGRAETHEAGFWRGQKATAKSIRNHLHDLTRPARAALEPQAGGE